MAVVDISAATLPELVRAVLDIKRSLADETFLWFRGHHCHSYSLLPKLMRYNKTPVEVFARERRLLTRFQQRSMAYWPAGYPQNDWEHLFAMQHYGAPTRLLDWTENLFVAAYFALSSTSDSHRHDPPECRPIVWCIDPVAWNRAMPTLSDYEDVISVLTTVDVEYADAYRPITQKPRVKSPVAIFGSHNSERIVAQRGTFFVWGNLANGLESFAASPGQTLLWRITLTGERSQLYSDLHALGFGETMIFPELSFLAAELDRTEGWR